MEAYLTDVVSWVLNQFVKVATDCPQTPHWWHLLADCSTFIQSIYGRASDWNRSLQAWNSWVQMYRFTVNVDGGLCDWCEENERQTLLTIVIVKYTILTKVFFSVTWVIWLLVLINSQFWDGFGHRWLIILLRAFITIITISGLCQ